MASGQPASLLYDKASKEALLATLPFFGEDTITMDVVELDDAVD